MVFPLLVYGSGRSRHRLGWIMCSVDVVNDRNQWVVGVPCWGAQVWNSFYQGLKCGLGKMEIILLYKVQLFCLNAEHAQRSWKDRGMDGGLESQ